MNHTPRSVVAYLDRYIVGQEKAKRAVAIALRNRIRRRMLSEELAAEVSPKNILMVGPTGVGKTEIARRLAKLVDAPFVKVEATKFTEVGYVGRDVESMVRDLVEASVQMVKKQVMEGVQAEAESIAKEKILDALLPQPKPQKKVPDFIKALGLALNPEDKEEPEEDKKEPPQIEAPSEKTREKLKKMLEDGKLDGRNIDVEVSDNSKIGMTIMGASGLEEMGVNLGEILGGMMPKKSKKKTLTVAEAKRVIQAEEAERLIDNEEVNKKAINKAEEEGIIFIDEIDKVASSGGSSGGGPDVSREGVQRDMLPIVEGCTVHTKYGPVKTDHVLFIAAGAFHKTKPSDLVPELQGRLPIRVELKPLSEDDLVRILKEPEGSLTKQYEALLGTEGVELKFCNDGIAALAKMATAVNRDMEDIGARRLHTMLELLLEEISFEAPETEQKELSINEAYVLEKLKNLTDDKDARKYML